MLQLDGIEWKVSELSPQVLLLEPLSNNSHLEYIHRLFRFLEEAEYSSIIDVVPAYRSIAIFFSNSKKDVLEFLRNADLNASSSKSSTVFHVEVDYEHGLDWDRAINKTGLSRSEIIEKHCKSIYTVAMIGFIPGFIFLDGLESALTVPRLETPRTKVPAGSIGIGGNQTGIYSLESPGGWNVIGNSSHTFFDIQENPPISISPGDKLKFKPIGD